MGSYKYDQMIQKQDCIPVGCVPPACCPYLPAYTAPGDAFSGEGGCLLPEEGCLVPVGCLLPGGEGGIAACNGADPPVDRILDTHY